MVINVSDDVRNGGNVLYLQNVLSETFTCADCKVETETKGERINLKVICPDHYGEIVRTEIMDKTAETVAINYKYNFFKKAVKVQGLNQVEREILLASLISADLPEDKKYCYQRFKDLNSVAIDGVYNFRLKPLRKQWEDIASYMPLVFMRSQLKEFIKFLLENKKKKAYVDGGKVYDSHYRRLKRVNLLDGECAKITREILLSGCGQIEISGKTNSEDEYYLREFYGDKIIFSTGY